MRPICAENVTFGNTFDRPLKLPWGSGAALKFMLYVRIPFLHSTPMGAVQICVLTPFLRVLLCGPDFGACT